MRAAGALNSFHFFMSTTIWILGSITGVGAISLFGVTLFTFRQHILDKAMLALIGFSTGALLGDVFLHMLPEMIEVAGEASSVWFMVLGGIVASFILEKYIHWHHCHVVDCADHTHPIGVMNIVGDMLHNALDGILIAGSYLVSVEVGIATTIAVVLHEIPQEISDTGILLYSGFSRKKAILFNALTGIAAVIGGVLVLLFQSELPSIGVILLPFAAGNFLYIAGSDLIPELHKETGLKQSTVQLIALLAGIAFMAGLMMLE